MTGRPNFAAGNVHFSPENSGCQLLPIADGELRPTDLARATKSPGLSSKSQSPKIPATSCDAPYRPIQLFDVAYNTFPNRNAEFDRHGVPDETPHSFCMDRFAFSYEFVVARKALKDCTFSKRNCAVLMRMSEPTVPEPKKLRRHRGRWFVPFHPSIHASICLAGFLLVTCSNKTLIPISPGSAGLRCADPFKIQLRQFRSLVQQVRRTDSSGFEARQFFNRIAHSLVFPRLNGRVYHFDRTMLRCQQD